MVMTCILAVCKEMQSPTNDKLIFVLLSDSRFSYAMLHGSLAWSDPFSRRALSIGDDKRPRFLRLVAGPPCWSPSFK